MPQILKYWMMKCNSEISQLIYSFYIHYFIDMKIIFIFIKCKYKMEIGKRSSCSLFIYLRLVATPDIHFLFNLFQINLSLHLIKKYQSRLKENNMVLYLDERLKEILAISCYNYYCFKWFCWITEEDLEVFSKQKLNSKHVFTPTSISDYLKHMSILSAM